MASRRRSDHRHRGGKSSRVPPAQAGRRQAAAVASRHVAKFCLQVPVIGVPKQRSVPPSKLTIARNQVRTSKKMTIPRGKPD